MAKFDISPVISGASAPGSKLRGSLLTAEDLTEAKDEPAPRPRYVSDSTRMCPQQKALGPKGLGPTFPRILSAISACFLGVTGTTEANPTTATRPDPPPRRAAPTVGDPNFRPSWDLDGTYLWLGPSGLANHTDDDWDSAIGGTIAIVRVRERSPLGAIGGVFGASLWSERNGGRLSLDAIAGTRLGRMLGVSAGPVLELSDTAHPRWGGSVGLWAFLGVTPFARVGIVDELGGFAEVGVHIALPAIRR